MLHPCWRTSYGYNTAEECWSNLVLKLFDFLMYRPNHESGFIASIVVHLTYYVWVLFSKLTLPCCKLDYITEKY